VIGQTPAEMSQLRITTDSFSPVRASLVLFGIACYLVTVLLAGPCPDPFLEESSHSVPAHHSSAQQTDDHFFCAWACQAGVGVGLTVSAPIGPVLFALGLVMAWTIRSRRSGSSFCTVVRGPPNLPSLP